MTLAHHVSRRWKLLLGLAAVLGAVNFLIEVLVYGRFRTIVVNAGGAFLFSIGAIFLIALILKAILGKRV
jgi:hypothetical protein